MFNRISSAFILLLIALMPVSFAYASNGVVCMVTVSKAPTWSQESVVVDVIDYATKEVIQTLHLPAATNNQPSVNSDTQTFDCHAHTLIQMQASYTPSIWSTDVGQTYLSKNTYNLYQQLLQAKQAGINKLEITLTFPDDFIGVPLRIQE